MDDKAEERERARIRTVEPSSLPPHDYTLLLEEMYCF
jgi:hypothetical protein